MIVSKFLSTPLMEGFLIKRGGFFLFCQKPPKIFISKFLIKTNKFLENEIPSFKELVQVSLYLLDDLKIEYLLEVV